MAVDPRLERLPEHEGPAFRTWRLIMQTTMGSVIPQPSSSDFQFTGDGLQQKSQMSPGDEFIALSKENDSDGKCEKTSMKKKSCQADEILTPWKSVDQYPSNAFGLHKEITDFHQYMSPLPEEESMRQNVVDRISGLILNVWPAAKVEVFGSFRTKLYLPTSDIDLSVFGKWENLPLFTLQKELIENEISDASTIKVLDKASVPIIKLTDKLSKIRVDISFNVESSIKSAEMIKSYINEYKILPSLFLTLKHFLVQRDLNEVFTGGISSYCLMLLTISFLQRHPRIDVRKSKANLGVLLMEFFELYGRNFNYQRIAVTLRGEGAYRNKEALAKELGEGVFLPLLCIEDPVTGSCDIGKSSYGILRVKEAFEYAFNVVDKALRKNCYFKVNRNSTYLSRIVSAPNDLCEYREWVRESYKPRLFVPKAKPTSPPILYPTQESNQFTTGGNGRPALLPTPPSPYSPRLPLVTPPFSPYSPSNNLHYNHMAFFDNDGLPPHLIISNVRSDKDVVSSQINGLKSPGVFNGKRFVNPNSPYVMGQDIPCFSSSNQSLIPNQQPVLQSPVKTLQSPSNSLNTMFPGTRHLSSILTTLHQQPRRPNNTLHCKPSVHNNHHPNHHHYHQQHQRNNNTRSSHRTSPMLSPKLNAKFYQGNESKFTRERPRQDDQRNFCVTDNLKQSNPSKELTGGSQNNEVFVLSDSNETEPRDAKNACVDVIILSDSEGK